MKTLLTLTLILTSLTVHANCTTNTIFVGDKMLLCTTCCVDNNCQTTCL